MRFLNILNMHKLKVLGFLIIFLTACVNINVGLTSIKKIKSDETHDYYVYKSYADTANKVDSPEAEASRIWVLNYLLKQNELPLKYEVINREVYTKSGNIKDVYYEIKISKTVK
jgi:hypothetical protein